ncbi:MAG: PD40 domain-containing protein, partial [Verrucomicrobia bacterium]|nr:PD40 domain-containing protein [Verrucomicrobiota bacterium]
NIIFVDGRPKLADIGLVADVGKTLSFVGTEGYLPPEGPGSPQADIYSLGKVLYEISTGKDRLDFPELPTNLEALREEESLLEFNEVLVRACQAQPHKRYASASQMHADLLLLKSGKSVKRMRMLETQLERAKKMGIAAALVAILAASGWYAVRRAERAANQSLARLHVEQGVRLMDEGDSFGALLWFVEALRLEEGHPEREARHRMRIASVLRPAPKLRHLWFHGASVTQADFSPDGSLAVTASRDGTARVWHVETGGEVFPPLRHGHEVHYVAFSPDNSKILTCCRDGTARIWRAADGQPITPSLRHPRMVLFGEFSPDSQRVVAVSGSVRESPEGEAIVWDVATAQPVFAVTNLQTRKAYFSPDGRKLLTTHEDKTARIWDLATGQQITPPMQHPASVREGAFSPDGQRVLAVARDAGVVRVWNALTGEPMTPPLAHPGKAHTASFSPDGKSILTVGAEWFPRVWDATSGQLLPPVFRHKQEVIDALFSPDGKYIITACQDQSVRLWDLQSGQLAFPPLPTSGELHEAFLSRNGRYLLATSHDGSVRLWDLAEEEAAVVLKDSAPMRSISFNPDGSRFVTTSHSGAKIWTTLQKQVVIALRPAELRPGSRVQGARFSSDNRRLVLLRSYPPVDNNGLSTWEVLLWDAATGQPMGTPVMFSALTNATGPIAFPSDLSRAATLNGKEVQVWDLLGSRPVLSRWGDSGGAQPNTWHAGFSPNGHRLVTTGEDGVARIWNADSGQQLGAFTYSHRLLGVTYSPDGRHVAVGAIDGTAHLFDAETGVPVTAFRGHNGWVQGAAFFKQGRRVVTHCLDGSVGVWDARTGELIALIQRNALSVPGSSPDGNLLFAACEGGGFEVWDATSGEPLTPRIGRGLAVGGPVLGSDGFKVAAACTDGQVRMWSLAKDERPIEEISLEVQVLNSSRIGQKGGFMTIDLTSLSNAWHTLRERYPDPSLRASKNGLLE